MHEDWKRLVIFCRISGLDKNYVLPTLNAYFSPSDARENERVWNSYTGENDVTEGSIIKILRKLNVAYDKDTLFPCKKYRFHNEHRIFYTPDRVWKMYEIEEFFKDVYSYVWGGGVTRFIYEEEHWKQFGLTRYKTIRTVICDNMPFSQPKTDVLVKVMPGIEIMVKALAKMIAKKIDKSGSEAQIKVRLEFKEKLKKTLERLGGLSSDADKYKLIESVIQFDPEEKSLGILFAKTKQRGKMKSEYHSFTTVPYIDQNPVAPDCLNIFPGFSMQRFRNTDVDIRKTTIWEWLWAIWANRDEKKLHWLLNYFATKIQQPERKICKFLVAFGRQTGTGKTSMQLWLKAILDEDKVLFCKNLEEYLSEQNHEHLNKLIVLIDDIERASKKQSDALKSSVTGNTIRYKKLYSDPITMPSYCDLIATSNERSPVFVSDQNRRVELITINPEKKGCDAFWDAFYAELKDPQVMGAWFEFFATFPIDLNVRSENNRFDRGVLSAEKVKSMKSSHQFVMKFFSDPRCFEDACIRRCDETHWFKDIVFRVCDGQKVCIIRKARAYQYYRHWAKVNGHRNIVKNNTFTDDLKEIDILPKRREMNGRKLYTFVFNRGRIKKTLACFYQLESKLVQLNWLFTGDDEFEKLQTSQREGRFLYRDNEKP
jgi:hypothetical protein